MWGLVLTLNTDFWPGHKGFWYGIVSNAGSIISGIKWDQVGCPDSLFGAAKKTCDVKLFSF